MPVPDGGSRGQRYAPTAVVPAEAGTQEAIKLDSRRSLPSNGVVEGGNDGMLNYWGISSEWIG